jgi:hypothetical protein
VSSKLELKGLTEFQRALRSLPDDLRNEAAVIVLAHRDYAQRHVHSAYAEGRTGRLRRGVSGDQDVSRFAVRGVLRSRAPHANLWEQQNPPKKRRTAQGYNRGTMRTTPESQKMIPIVIRRRRAMVHALIELVKRAGFQVTQT